MLQQLQSCLQPAINALMSDQVLGEEAVADVITILEQLDAPDTASEALYDIVMEKSDSDPNIVVRFLESVGKVNLTICNLVRSSARLTWQQLRQKREEVVQTLDTSAVLAACAEKGIITQQQHQGLLRIKKMGKPSDFINDRFLHVLEKLSNDEQQASQLEEFEKILMDKQPNVLKTLLEAGKYTQYTLDFVEAVL